MPDGGELEDGRDYLGEMSVRIAEATEGSGWVAPIVAAKLHAELLEKDPDLLDGWLHEIAVGALRQAICNRDRQARGEARRRSGSRAFARASAEAEETGDTAPLLGMFSVVHVVDANVRKRAADMTGEDHRFLAGSYRQSANETLMLAAFHQAVADKVGRKRTADVFSEAQYEAMYQSIVRSPGSEAA